MSNYTYDNSFVENYSNKNGDYYCRIVHGILNSKLDQSICCNACPLFKNNQCDFYKTDEWNLDSPEETYEIIDKAIEEGEETLFPTLTKEENEDLYDISKAYAYAAQAHKGLKRKGTKVPYFSHLITTLGYEMMLTNDKDLWMASLLHDTVEDTWVTVNDIRNEFGDTIANYVASETENKRADVPAEQTWELRKRENIVHLERSSSEVKMIVMADKIANAESMLKEWRIQGDTLWNKFNQHDKRKHAWYYYGCAKALKEFSDTSVMKIYMSYLDEMFSDVR